MALRYLADMKDMGQQMSYRSLEWNYTWKDGAMQDLNALGPRLQLDLLRDWPKLALDQELWRGVASRC